MHRLISCRRPLAPVDEWERILEAKRLRFQRLADGDEDVATIPDTTEKLSDSAVELGSFCSADFRRNSLCSDSEEEPMQTSQSFYELIRRKKRKVVYPALPSVEIYTEHNSAGLEYLAYLSHQLEGTNYAMKSGDSIFLAEIVTDDSETDCESTGGNSLWEEDIKTSHHNVLLALQVSAARPLQDVVDTANSGDGKNATDASAQPSNINCTGDSKLHGSWSVNERDAATTSPVLVPRTTVTSTSLSTILCANDDFRCAQCAGSRSGHSTSLAIAPPHALTAQVLQDCQSCQAPSRSTIGSSRTNAI